MLNIKTFVCNMLQENCFVVNDETGEAVVIDCGAYYEEERQAVADYISGQRLQLKHLLCTHGHFDHVFGNDTIARVFGVAPQLHQADDFLLRSMPAQVEMMMGCSYEREVPQAVHFLTDGEVIAFGSHQMEVIHTPGHTPGGVVFHCAAEHVLFSGDTLFRMSVGRTDLNGGSWEQLIGSLRSRVASLPADTTVYCGHGPQTTIGFEQRMNPFMKV